MKKDRKSHIEQEQPGNGGVAPVNISSATGCTGMLYKPPVTDAETEGYDDVYSVPQQTDISGQKTDTPGRQKDISSVKKGRRRAD